MNNRVTKKVVLDAYRGGDDIGSNANGIIEKDYNLAITKYIYDRLRSLGVPVSITRDADETLDMNQRIQKIRSFYGNGNDVIVISNTLTTGGEGAEVVYALRNSNALSQRVANELEKTGIEVDKFYQRRLPSNPSLDYNPLIRDTINNESLIIYYGNVDQKEEADILKNRMEELGEAVVIALADYLNIDYQPVSGSDYYIVQKGDSLYSIANQFQTTVQELKSLNQLTTNTLQIGQVLKIPSKNNNMVLEENIYTVLAGDNLYSIARKYNTTVDQIKELNGLTSNTLSIGQKLKIPSSTSEEENTEYISYTVVSGDKFFMGNNE